MTKSLLRTAPDQPADPDAELAARVASGDHPAFETLLRRHNRALFRGFAGERCDRVVAGVMERLAIKERL